MRNPYQRSNTHSSTVSVQTQYRQFIDSIVRNNCVYGLYQQGWAMCATPSGQHTLALWQAQSLAQLMQCQQWANYQIEAIDLKELLQQILPYARQHQTHLSLNLKPEGQNILVKSSVLLLDLKDALYTLYLKNPQHYLAQGLPEPRKIRLHSA